jgi:hypothetical protein
VLGNEEQTSIKNENTSACESVELEGDGRAVHATADNDRAKGRTTVASPDYASG